ncbi:hypothetical protein CAL29_19780 [Bordetella genomosp. 10]|uniref:DUF4175 domain-containing protein n=1 Tax=Bordetella genomosp. 10 TaxID=1416804 RepID=A0A261RZH5_9BORD|nr:hypothetical protein [Bordetella genomosp. 10]OZI30291.1 hypothetical protein CAL29_19780 [Bordetella genomosp. 10]
MAASHNFWFVWRIPTLLGLLTVFGLLAALLGTGPWHWASWVAMALPLVVIALCLIRPAKRQHT